MLPMTNAFVDQVSAAQYVVDVFYIIATMATLLAIFALAFIDGGVVSPKHLVDTIAQKLLSALIAGTCCMIGGYAIWISQFNQAFDVPHPLRQAFADWWLLGHYLGVYPQSVDPAILPGAETQQVFVAFFFTYAGMLGAFVHSMGIGRMKPSATYILSALTGGLIMPVLAYLTWGPASPLTNNGLHDYIGSCSVYMFVGTWALILTWRLGPRLASTNSFNPFMFGLGAMMLMLSIPVFCLGCGFLEPGVGYFGVNNTTSGLGIVFCNIFFSFGGGALSGAFIAYRKHKAVFAFFGPVAGYVTCTSFFDIAAPWQCLVAGAIGPWVLYLLKELMTVLNLDDQKLVPLALGPSIVSMLLAGVIGSGLPTGGVAGAAGAYAFQHAHISFGMQCLGILVTLVYSGVTGLILVFAIEKTIGLRVVPTIEQDGLDTWYWNEWRKSRKMRVPPKSLSTYEIPRSVEP